MIEAVLFDWGNTLVRFEWDDELVAAAHEAALGTDDPAFTNRWREAVLDGRRRPYADILRELGVDDPDAFIDAEHAVWQSATTVLASAQALLESLRTRGIKTGVAAVAWPDPPRLLRADAERLGLAECLDAIVFAEDAKPFQEALDQLGVDPVDAMYVGDKLLDDVQGAANMGMTTIQALWFAADDTPATVEPDFMAFTPMDVLNAVRRLAP